MVPKIEMPRDMDADEIVSHVLMGTLNSLCLAGFDSHAVHINAALGLVACVGVLEAKGVVERKAFMAEIEKAFDEGANVQRKADGATELIRKAIEEALTGEKKAQH